MFGFERIWELILFVLFNLVFWGGLIALIVLVLSRLRAGSSSSALNILNERFARGEIDQQEYEQRKAALLKQ